MGKKEEEARRGSQRRDHGGSTSQEKEKGRYVEKVGEEKRQKGRDKVHTPRCAVALQEKGTSLVWVT